MKTITKPKRRICLYSSKDETECQLFQCGKTKTTCKFKSGAKACMRDYMVEDKEEGDGD